MNVYQLVVGSVVPKLVLYLSAAALIFSQARVCFALMRKPRWTTWCAAGCRLVGSAMVLLVLFELEQVQREEHQEAGRFAFVVDDSASMAAPARLQAGVAFAQQHAATLLQDENPPQLQWHGLAQARHGPPLAADATAPVTDLLAALEQVVRSEGDSLRGILVVSDGADNAALRDMTTLDDAARARLDALRVPISTLYAAERTPPPDCMIVDVQYDQRGYVKSAQQLDVELRCEGMPPATRLLRLFAGTETIGEQEVVLPDSRTAPHTQNIAVPLRPKERGTTGYELELEAQDNEQDTQNNRFALLVTATRERTRVLHVAGQPSLDVRFLRQALRSQANIELVSFYILRGLHSDMSVPEREMALIPFPVDQLFTTELKNFDVVVLQNFDARPFGMTRYLPQLHQAIVNDGVGLLMVGGPQSFGAGGYDNGPLAELLPVHLRSDDFVRDSFTLRAADARSLQHPLGLALGSCCEGLKLDGRNAFAALGEGGQAVLVASTGKAQGAPLLATARRGKGHVVALGTDALWQLRLSQAATASTQQGYERLWQRAIAYLVGDEDSGPVRLALSPAIADASGPPTRVTIDVDEAPRGAGAHVPLDMALVDRHGSAIWEATWHSDAAGHAEGMLPRVPVGLYTVQASLQTRPQDVASAPLAVRTLGDELRRRTPRPKLLAELARYSGGVALQLEGRAVPLPQLPAPPGELRGVHNQPIWPQPWVVVVGVVAWLAAWALAPQRQRG